MVTESPISTVPEGVVTIPDAAFKSIGVEPPKPSSAQAEPKSQPAGDGAETGAKTPDSQSQTDTLAAAERKTEDGSQKSEVQQPDQKTQETSKETHSAFAKDQERLKMTWKNANAIKEETAREKAQLKAERELFAREQTVWKEKQAKASASKFSPEQYEQGATQMLANAETFETQADGWDARAVKLEDEGKDREASAARAKAKDLRENASAQKYQAKLAKEQAAQLRTQPPDPTLQQIQQRNQKLLQDWTVKAASEFPEFAKDGGEFQQKVVGHIQAAMQQGLDVNEHPILMYHVARLTAAETASARVPGLEKELGVAKARVKELEALTTPGGGDSSVQTQPGAPKFGELSIEAQEAALRGQLKAA